jgi:hypothetical protein
VLPRKDSSSIRFGRFHAVWAQRRSWDRSAHHMAATGVSARVPDPIGAQYEPWQRGRIVSRALTKNRHPNRAACAYLAPAAVASASSAVHAIPPITRHATFPPRSGAVPSNPWVAGKQRKLPARVHDPARPAGSSSSASTAIPALPMVVSKSARASYSVAPYPQIASSSQTT